MSMDAGTQSQAAFGKAALDAMIHGVGYIKISYDKEEGLMWFEAVDHADKE